MSGAAQHTSWRHMTNWPSGRLLEYAEAHPHDADLLEFIHGELGRRDVEVAATAARRVAQLLARAQGRANGAAEASVEGAASEEAQMLIATLRARLEAAERRVREAEARA
ncbi:hypothetical protein GXW77_21740, partial [Roseomonas alkaliterrae]